MKQEIADIKSVFDQHWPSNNLIIEELGDHFVRIRQRPKSRTDLRPGGTVSGPFMMTLVDTALYAAVLAATGRKELAVTTSLNINFLNKPRANTDVIAECNLLKVGRKLIVGEVSLYSEGNSEPIAHATGTYSVPNPKTKN